MVWLFVQEEVRLLALHVVRIVHFTTAIRYILLVRTTSRATKLAAKQLCLMTVALIFRVSIFCSIIFSNCPSIVFSDFVDKLSTQGSQIESVNIENKITNKKFILSMDSITFL